MCKLKTYFKPILSGVFVVLLFLSVFKVPYLSLPLTWEEKKTITVNGEGIIKALPDTANLSVSIEAEGDNAKIAREKNANKTQKIKEVLSSLGVKKEDIKTQWFNINKHYEYIDQKREEKGYRANHNLNITIHNLEKVDQVIDKLSEQGINHLGDVKYTLEDKDKINDKARKIAFENAEKKVLKLADIFGVKKLRVLKISENSAHSSGVPYYGISGKGGGESLSNGIETGQIEVSLDLNVVYEIN
jgi:hypothetical protein